MARTRNIKPGFFKNEELAECEPLARLLYAGLWTEADREGRLEDRPKRIKAEVLPYDNCDIEGLLGQLASWGFILRYEVSGHRYIQITTWHKHQQPHVKEAESVIPAPVKHGASTVQAPDKNGTSTEQESLDTSSLILDTSSLNLDTGAAKAPARAKRGTKVPEPFVITPDLLAYAKARAPLVDPVIETEQFVNYYLAKGTPSKDWCATWRNWMVKAQQYKSERQAKSNGKDYSTRRRPTAAEAGADFIERVLSGEDENPPPVHRPRLQS